MNIPNLTSQLGRILRQNTPAILTGLAVGGLFSSTYLTARATVRAVDEIELHDLRTPKEKFEGAWRFYVPTALSLAATTACIIGAHTVSSRRQAALISAYTLSERALSEYKEKVLETIGPKKEEEIRSEIAKDRIEENPPSDRMVLVSGTDVLCYDVYTDRYFRSSVETIRRAMNDVNEQCFNQMYASLNDYYRAVGLDPIPPGDDFGWSSDAPLELSFSSIMAKENVPAVAVEFRKQPRPDYTSVF